MKADDSTDYFRSRWSTSERYRTDTFPLHVWKSIVPGKTVLSLESDAFRKRINDTLLFQLNIDTKIHRDSSVTVTGLVFYTQTMEYKSISLDFDNQYKPIDSLGVDSIKKSWRLNF